MIIDKELRVCGRDERDCLNLSSPRVKMYKRYMYKSRLRKDVYVEKLHSDG